MDNYIPLLVRLDGKTIQIRASLDWSIYQLKQQLYIHSNSPLEDLKVVFAGSELENSVLLKNCYLSHGTVVHVIVLSSKNNENRKQNHIPPMNFIAPTADGIETQNKSRRSRFYVYCKDTSCNTVRPGKLRVRCKRCKDEAFEIGTGPSCWKDVLTPGMINGICNKFGCDENIAEFYFKCADDSTQENHHDTASTIPLPLLRTNIQDAPCLACMDISEIILVFPCDDSHVICLDCFSTYCQTKLNHRQFILSDGIGYTLPCPSLGDSCSNKFIEEVHHFMIAGKVQYERYKNFATEEFVLQNGGLLCPGEGCGNGILLEGSGRKIICYQSRGGCGLVFCKECRLNYHDGNCQQSDTQQSEDNTQQNTYQINQLNAAQARWRDDMESRETIQRTSKPCPGCKTPTEKSGGCNHMTCLRCQNDWCWLCQIQWGRNCEADHWFRAG